MISKFCKSLALAASLTFGAHTSAAGQEGPLALFRIMDELFLSAEVYVLGDYCRSSEDVLKIQVRFHRAETLSLPDMSEFLASSAARSLSFSAHDRCYEDMGGIPFTVKIENYFDGTLVSRNDVQVRPDELYGASAHIFSGTLVKTEAVQSVPVESLTDEGRILDAYYSRIISDNVEKGLVLNSIAREFGLNPQDMDVFLIAAEASILWNDDPWDDAIPALLDAASTGGDVFATVDIARNARLPGIVEFAKGYIQDGRPLPDEEQNKLVELRESIELGVIQGSWWSMDFFALLEENDAVLTPEGLVYELYEGVRKEDVETGVLSWMLDTPVSALQNTLGPSGDVVTAGISCDVSWCTFADGTRWRLLTSGRPSCSYQGDDAAMCQFSTRPIVNLDDRRNVLERYINSVATAEWTQMSASFTRTGDVWEMSGSPQAID